MIQKNNKIMNTGIYIIQITLQCSRIGFYIIKYRNNRKKYTCL